MHHHRMTYYCPSLQPRKHIHATTPACVTACLTMCRILYRCKGITTAWLAGWHNHWLAYHHACCTVLITQRASTRCADADMHKQPLSSMATMQGHKLMSCSATPSWTLHCYCQSDAQPVLQYHPQPHTPGWLGITGHTHAHSALTQ
jgi:hypothetical protein